MAEFMKFNVIVGVSAKQCANNMDRGSAAAFLVAQQKYIQEKAAEARRSGAKPAGQPAAQNSSAKTAASGGMARLQAMLSKK